MSLSQKASIAQVSIGKLSIEGLMAEDGTFGIAVPQLISHNLISQDNSNREAKTYMGASSNLVKWRTEISKRPVNVILLTDFEKLLAKLDRAGNKAAQGMRDDLVGLALTQLFSDAFGLKFEKEERQAYLIDRQAQKKSGTNDLRTAKAIARTSILSSPHGSSPMAVRASSTRSR
jgi:hypothetical protein